MGIIILIVVVLMIGISIGLMIGFSRAVQKAARETRGLGRPIVGRLTAGIGGLGLLLALGSWIYNLHFTHVAIHTTGTVIEMQQQTDKDSGSISYAPTFHFQDATGTPHTVSSIFFQSPPAFQVGDAVGVLYLPNHPQTACIDDFWQIWGLPALAGILGGIALAIGLLLILWPKFMGQWKGQSVSGAVH